MKTPSILIVDDNPSIIQVIAKMLAGVGQLRFATGGEQALQLMRAALPDLVLLDAEMPGMTGYEVCAVMKADEALVDVPVIFVTGHGETEAEVRGLDVGAVDFITKPVHQALLLARVRTQLRIKSLTDELRRMATTDGLTGLINRRHFDELMRREWQRAMRTQAPLALLIVDIDHFKRYNDHYGHPAGDACLQAVAGALQSTAARGGDWVARLGGEEFAILLPDTDEAGARDVASHMVQAVRGMAFPHEASETAAHLTVSIGAASGVPQRGEAETASDLMVAADQALYEAKAQGRDRHCSRPLY